jgi:type IV secretion system protein VirB10
MRSRLIALLSMATLVSAQTPHAYLQSAVPAAVAGQVAAPATAHILTVPAGTAIPLTLINPIKKKSTQPGDAVRATVAFPIMAGVQVAIPAGSYVEGVVQQLTARASDTHQPQVGIHFTRLVFANGYSVNLDANSAQAEEVAPSLGAPVTELASIAPPLASMGLFAQTSQPTLSNPGPSPAVITGAMLGGGAALMILIFAAAHHSQSKVDYVLFDAGWQFQMVLQSPLMVDADRVAAAAAAPSAN